MLVLSRKNGESLRIGNDVLVRVLVTSRGQVRLGIEAPPDKVVLREELYEKIVTANRAAATATAASATGGDSAISEAVAAQRSPATVSAVGLTAATTAGADAVTESTTAVKGDE